MGGADAPSEVRVSLLGGFGATIDGEPVSDRWRLRKAKTLVKLLALAPGHRLHRDAVVELLWPDSEPGAATNNLHQAVHAARRVFGANRITLSDDLLTLCPADALTVDVEGFETTAAEARVTGDVGQLRQALERWTGPLLPEDEYERWSTTPRERLTETRDALRSLLAARLVDAGEPESALQLLEPLTLERPTDEPLHRALIGALTAVGRRWEAIAAYERLREALDAEYAAAPAAETRALYRALLTGAAPPATRPHNLPGPSTSFIGRHRELRELASALDRTRLLTLSGPGGAGKSRLGVELGRGAATSSGFPDGVWCVELAGLKEGELVGSTVAAALGITLPGGTSSILAVADQLATRRMLLLLDNCEHLLRAVGELVAAVLARGPDITVVTTSREPLGLAGEMVYRVPSLPVPPIESKPDLGELSRLGAVQLFVERAQQVAPRFQLVEDNAEAIAQVCHRVDGMPLALELAAARLAHLSVTEVADHLTDALALLARQGGRSLDRQETLAGTLDWSHDLLEPLEQVAFRRLAVFAGGFDLEAAGHVCVVEVPVLDVVSRLVDKSLVEADTSASVTRYRMLEPVRQYADVRLSESEDAQGTRRRHREWYAAAAAAHDPDRGEPVVGEPSAWFDVEQDNVRAALSSALGEDPTLSLALATATWRFWVTRGLIGEGDRWLTLALGRCPERSVLRARALSATSVLKIRQGQARELPALGDEIAALLAEHGDPAEAAHGRHYRALLEFMSGDIGQATTLVAEALHEAAPFPAVRGSAEHLAGIMALSRGDVARTRTWFDAARRSVADAPPEGAPYFVGMNLAWVVDDRTDPPMPYGEETMLQGRRVGARQASGHLTIARALVERLSGRDDLALSLIDEAGEIFASLGDRFGQAYAAAQRGHTMRWIGDLAQADRHLAESERLRRDLRDQRSVALSVSGRAIAAAAAGEQDVARARAREALGMMERTGDTPGLALASANLAITEVLLGDPEAALASLERPLALPDIPGGHRSHGWMRLFKAHLLRQLGRPESSAATLATQKAFASLGEQQGLAAVQRACKAGVLRLPDDQLIEEEP